MRTIISAVALLLATLCFSWAERPDATSATAVSRSIGFRVIERTDAARASKRFPNGRPIQIAFWYPAASASPDIVYRDYVLLTARETSLRPLTEDAEREAVAQYRTLLGSAGVKPEEADFLLATKMRATRDASPAPGRFPLVLIAPGDDQSALDQAFLAELLAARGYVVATAPSQTRIGGRMTSEQEIPAHAEEQAADLAMVLRTARFESPVRPGKYGIVAASFGARSALLAAMRDPEVAALVSLDGGIGAKNGKGLLEKETGFQRARATVPILHFYEEADRSMTPDFELLRSLDRADRWLVKVDGMFPAHFSSAGVFVRTVPALAKATSADEHTSAAWDAVAEATASFLDRFVADSGSAKGSGGHWMLPASSFLHPSSLPAAPATAKKP